MPKAGSQLKMMATYGEEADRIRLFLVSQAFGMSQSAWLLKCIREAYFNIYGDQPVEEAQKGA